MANASYSEVGVPPLTRGILVQFGLQKMFYTEYYFQLPTGYVRHKSGFAYKIEPCTAKIFSLGRGACMGRADACTVAEQRRGLLNVPYGVIQSFV